MNLTRIKINIQPHILRGTLYLLLAVLFWGVSAPLAKLLIINKFSTLVVVQTRSLLSFCVLLLLFGFFRRSFFCIETKDIVQFFLLGVVGLACTNYFYYYTVTEATVATAILIQYTAPVWVIVYVSIIRKYEDVRLFTLLALLMALGGCLLAVTSGSFQQIRLPGNTWLTAPLSAITFAFQIVMTKRLLQKYSIWTIVLFMTGFATFFWFLINPPWLLFSHQYTTMDWSLLLIFAVISILIPQAAFAKGLRFLKASTSGIITTLEPVIAIVAAYFLLSERLTFLQIIGAMFVVTAIIILQRGQKE